MAPTASIHKSRSGLVCQSIHVVADSAFSSLLLAAICNLQNWDRRWKASVVLIVKMMSDTHSASSSGVRDCSCWRNQLKSMHSRIHASFLMSKGSRLLFASSNKEFRSATRTSKNLTKAMSEIEI
jgi:hypothetical protein